MADKDLNVDVGVNLTSQPAPGIQSSEMKVMVAATALTTVAGIFHKQLDMDQAVKFIDALAGLYVIGRSGVKMAHALAAAVMAWVAQQKVPQTRTIVMPPLPMTPAPAAVPPQAAAVPSAPL